MTRLEAWQIIRQADPWLPPPLHRLLLRWSSRYRRHRERLIARIVLQLGPLEDFPE